MSVPRPEWFGPKGGPYPCPCCGYLTLFALEQFADCRVCHWEDDGQTDADADVVRGGPNSGLSLTTARERYRQLGTTRLHLPGGTPRDDERPGRPPTASQQALLDAVAQTGPVVLREVDLEEQPLDVVAAAGRLWLTTRTGQHASVVVLDPDTGRPVGKVTLPGRGPPRAIVAGEDAVWVLCLEPNESVLVRIDLATLATAFVPIVGVMASLVAGNSVLYLGSHGRDPSVVVVDQVTLSVRRAITVKTRYPAGLHALAAISEDLWVAVPSRHPGRSAVLRATTTTAVEVPGYAGGLAADGEDLWVSNTRDGVVWRIDTARCRITATIDVGDHPCRPVIDGPTIWVSNHGSGTVSRIDARAAAVTGTAAVGIKPGPPVRLGDRLWLVRSGDRRLVCLPPAFSSTTHSH